MNGQLFDQGEVYLSSREGAILVRSMPVPHAGRAYAKLLDEFGIGFAKTVLGESLRGRANLATAQATEVHSFRPGAKMLRGHDGRFVGTWTKHQEAPRVFKRTTFEYEVDPR